MTTNASGSTGPNTQTFLNYLHQQGVRDQQIDGSGKSPETSDESAKDGKVQSGEVFAYVLGNYTQFGRKVVEHFKALSLDLSFFQENGSLGSEKKAEVQKNLAGEGKESLKRATRKIRLPKADTQYTDRTFVSRQKAIIQAAFRETELPLLSIEDQEKAIKDFISNHPNLSDEHKEKISHNLKASLVAANQGWDFSKKVSHAVTFQARRLRFQFNGQKKQDDSTQANQTRDQAQKLLQAALEIDPTNAHAHLLMGRFYADAGKRKEAREHLAQAARNSEDLLLLKEVGRTFKSNRHPELLDDDETPLGFVANRLLESGKYTLAMKAYQSAIKKTDDPKLKENFKIYLMWAEEGADPYRLLFDEGQNRAAYHLFYSLRRRGVYPELMDPAPKGAGSRILSAQDIFNYIGDHLNQKEVQEVLNEQGITLPEGSEERIKKEGFAKVMAQHYVAQAQEEMSNENPQMQDWVLATYEYASCYGIHDSKILTTLGDLYLGKDKKLAAAQAYLRAFQENPQDAATGKKASDAFSAAFYPAVEETKNLLSNPETVGIAQARLTQLLSDYKSFAKNFPKTFESQKGFRAAGEIVFNLGLIQQAKKENKLAEGSFQAALKYLNQSIEKGDGGKSDAPTLATRAAVQAMLGNLKEAYEDLGRASTLDEKFSKEFDGFKKSLNDQAESHAQARKKHQEKVPPEWPWVALYLTEELKIHEALGNSEKIKELSPLLQKATQGVSLSDTTKELQGMASQGLITDETMKPFSDLAPKGVDKILMPKGLTQLSDYVSVAKDKGQTFLKFTDGYEKLSPSEKSLVLLALRKAGERAFYVKSAAEAKDPTRKLYFASRIDLMDGNFPAARLKMRDFKEKTQGTRDKDLKAWRKEIRRELRELNLNGVKDLKGQLKVLLQTKKVIYKTEMSRQLALLNRIEELLQKGRVDTLEEGVAYIEKVEGKKVEAGVANYGDFFVINYQRPEGSAQEVEKIAMETLRANIRSGKVKPEDLPPGSGDSIKGLYDKVPRVHLRGGRVYVPNYKEGGRSDMPVVVGKEGGTVYMGGHSFHFKPSEAERVVWIDAPMCVVYGAERESWSRGTTPINLPTTKEKKSFQKIPQWDQIFALQTGEGLKKIQTPESKKGYFLSIGQQLRESGISYELSGLYLESVFAEELDAGYGKISQAKVAELKKEVEENRSDFVERVGKQLNEFKSKNAQAYQAQIDQLKKQDELDGKPLKTETEYAQALLDANVKLAMDGALAMRLKQEAMVLLRDKHDAGDIQDANVAQAWSQFNDMKDPTGEWTNFSDETWDMIIEEACTTAVFMVFTMGAGAMVRGGLKSTQWIARIASKGRYWSMAVDAGIYIAGNLAEAAVETSLEASFTDRDFTLKRFGYNFLMSSAFHGGAKVWEKAAAKKFSREAMEEAAEALETAVRRGEMTQWAAKRQMMLLKAGATGGQLGTQTTMATLATYGEDILFDAGNPQTFWERFGGSAVRMTAMHFGSQAFNRATGNLAIKVEMLGQARLDKARDTYRDLRSRNYSHDRAMKKALKASRALQIDDRLQVYTPGKKGPVYEFQSGEIKPLSKEQEAELKKGINEGQDAPAVAVPFKEPPTKQERHSVFRDQILLGNFELVQGPDGRSYLKDKTSNINFPVTPEQLQRYHQAKADLRDLTQQFTSQKSKVVPDGETGGFKLTDAQGNKLRDATQAEQTLYLRIKKQAQAQVQAEPANQKYKISSEDAAKLARHVLGLSEGIISGPQIKKAWHQFVSKNHPDKHPGDPLKVAEFQEAKILYDHLYLKTTGEKTPDYDAKINREYLDGKYNHRFHENYQASKEPKKPATPEKISPPIETPLKKAASIEGSAAKPLEPFVPPPSAAQKFKQAPVLKLLEVFGLKGDEAFVKEAASEMKVDPGVARGILTKLDFTFKVMKEQPHLLDPKKIQDIRKELFRAVLRGELSQRAVEQLHTQASKGNLKSRSLGQALGLYKTPAEINLLESQLGSPRSKWLTELAADPVVFKERHRVINTTAAQINGRIVYAIIKGRFEDRADFKRVMKETLEIEGIPLSTDTGKAIDSMFDIVHTAHQAGILDTPGGISGRQMTDMLTTLYLHQSPHIRLGGAELTHVPMVVQGTVDFMNAMLPRGMDPVKRAEALKSAFITSLYHDAGKWDVNIKTHQGYQVLPSPMFNKSGKVIEVKPGEDLATALANRQKEGVLTAQEAGQVNLGMAIFSAIIGHHDSAHVHKTITEDLVTQGILSKSQATKIIHGIERHALVSSWIVKNSLGGFGVKTKVFEDPKYRRFLDLYVGSADQPGLMRDIQEGRLKMADLDSDPRVQQLRAEFKKVFSDGDRAVMLGDHRGQVDPFKYVLAVINSPANAKASVHQLLLGGDLSNNVAGVLRNHFIELKLLDPRLATQVEGAFASGTAWMKQLDPAQAGLGKALMDNPKTKGLYEKWKSDHPEKAKGSSEARNIESWLSDMPAKSEDGKGMSETLAAVHKAMERPFYEFYALKDSQSQFKFGAEVKTPKVEEPIDVTAHAKAELPEPPPLRNKATSAELKEAREIILKVTGALPNEDLILHAEKLSREAIELREQGGAKNLYQAERLDAMAKALREKVGGKAKVGVLPVKEFPKAEIPVKKAAEATPEKAPDGLKDAGDLVRLMTVAFGLGQKGTGLQGRLALAREAIPFIKTWVSQVNPALGKQFWNFLMSVHQSGALETLKTLEQRKSFGQAVSRLVERAVETGISGKGKYQPIYDEAVQLLDRAGIPRESGMGLQLTTLLSNLHSAAKLKVAPPPKLKPAQTGESTRLIGDAFRLAREMGPTEGRKALTDQARPFFTQLRDQVSPDLARAYWNFLKAAYRDSKRSRLSTEKLAQFGSQVSLFIQKTVDKGLSGQAKMSDLHNQALALLDKYGFARESQVGQNLVDLLFVTSHEAGNRRREGIAAGEKIADPNLRAEALYLVETETPFAFAARDLIAGKITPSEYLAQQQKISGDLVKTHLPAIRKVNDFLLNLAVRPDFPVEIIFPGVGRAKDPKKIISKLIARQWTDLAPLTDYVGNRVIIETPPGVDPVAAAQKVVEQLKTKFNVRYEYDSDGTVKYEVIDTKKVRGEDVDHIDFVTDLDGDSALIVGKKSGYRARHVVVEVPMTGRDGKIQYLPVEIQVKPAAMHEWSQAQHKLIYKSPLEGNPALYKVVHDHAKAVSDYLALAIGLQKGEVPAKKPAIDPDAQKYLDDYLATLTPDQAKTIRDNLKTLNDLMDQYGPAVSKGKPSDPPPPASEKKAAYRPAKAEEPNAPRAQDFLQFTYLKDDATLKAVENWLSGSEAPKTAEGIRKLLSEMAAPNSKDPKAKVITVDPRNGQVTIESVGDLKSRLTQLGEILKANSINQGNAPKGELKALMERIASRPDLKNKKTITEELNQVIRGYRELVPQMDSFPKNFSNDIALNFIRGNLSKHDVEVMIFQYQGLLKQAKKWGVQGAEGAIDYFIRTQHTDYFSKPTEEFRKALGELEKTLRWLAPLAKRDWVQQLSLKYRTSFGKFLEGLQPLLAKISPELEGLPKKLQEDIVASLSKRVLLGKVGMKEINDMISLIHGVPPAFKETALQSAARLYLDFGIPAIRLKGADFRSMNRLAEDLSQMSILQRQNALELIVKGQIKIGPEGDLKTHEGKIYLPSPAGA